jgi:hypothetical protein
MENMLSRNSFPQICVVSVNQSLPIVEIRQEYEGSGATCVRTCSFTTISARIDPGAKSL